MSPFVEFILGIVPLRSFPLFKSFPGILILKVVARCPDVGLGSATTTSESKRTKETKRKRVEGKERWQEEIRSSINRFG